MHGNMRQLMEQMGARGASWFDLYKNNLNLVHFKISINDDLLGSLTDHNWTTTRDIS